jgi:hypothetical protein
MQAGTGRKSTGTSSITQPTKAHLHMCQAVCNVLRVAGDEGKRMQKHGSQADVLTEL